MTPLFAQGENSLVSLALHAIDGMLAFENTVNGRRSFGKLVHEDNIWGVYKNVIRICQELVRGKISGNYRAWLWLLAYSYKKNNQPILAAKHIPFLNFFSKNIPKTLFSKKIAEAVNPYLVDTPWNTSLSCLGRLDKVWLGGASVIVLPELNTSDFCLAGVPEKLREALEDILYEDRLGELFIDVEENEEEKNIGKFYTSTRKILQQTFKKDPALLSCMYLSIFYPITLKNILRIQTMNQLDKIFRVDILTQHVYTLLQLGMPAMHKTLDLDYPHTNPIEPLLI